MTADSEKEQTQEYQIHYLSISEDGEAVRKILQKQGVQIIERKDPVKTFLDYPIKKNKRGFLGLISFSAEPSETSSLSSFLGLESDILRFMIIKQPGKKTSESSAEQKTAFFKNENFSIKKSEKKIFASAAKKEPVQILTNEFLEKKIEEILS
jgi:ribosomal protein S6